MVFRTGQASPPAKYARFLFLLLTALNIRPLSRPSRILGTIHVNTVPNGLIPRSIAPNALVPKHCSRLVIPNAAPQIAPPFGPRIIAATATGTVRNVIDSPGVLRYPNGVNAITKMIAIISASSTRYFVPPLVLVVVVASIFCSPFLLIKRHFSKCSPVFQPRIIGK